MLNYIWAGLIVFAMVFALRTDIGDLRHNTYRNGQPLAATIRFHNPPAAAAREASVDLVIDPAEYSAHFGLADKVANSYPAILSKLESGYQIRVAKDASLPARLATMRDFTDAKELQAR